VYTSSQYTLNRKHLKLFTIEHWLQTWGTNYPSWVMGPFTLSNGLFFSISVLTATYFIVHKLARENRPNRRFNLWLPSH